MKRFLAMLLTLVMLAGAVPAALAAEAPEGYYGYRLTDPAAIAFYQALEAMDFSSGGNLPVTDPAVVGLAEAYAGGSDALIRSFGAAVDSFRYDHTEFFYVDWDMLSVNVGRRNGQYVVNIGSGRTDSYLRDKNADIAAQIGAYNTALDAMVADVQEKAGPGATIKDVAKAANDAVCKAVTYDFCDDSNGNATADSKYIRTAYGALVNGRAVCEGYSRLYKAVLDELGVECELVSGYFLDGESFEPHMWNYVQDEAGRWYAVDVTMNDGHRLQAGGVETTFEKYFWQTEELFAIDHIEDKRVSSVEYEMPYPELYRAWKELTNSGRFECKPTTYEGSPAFSLSFDGKSADELKDEGLYMAVRTATTNTGTVIWSPWQSVHEYNRLIENSVPSVGHETYFRLQSKSMAALEVGVFDIPEDVKYSEFAYTYSEEAVMTHLVEMVSVENPGHDADYIAPAYVSQTTPEELFQRRQDITQTQHVELVYSDQLREIGDGFTLTWDVSSYNNRDLSLEAVQKNAKLENVQFDGDRTISFDFTPSRAYNHNMIFYHFTPHNIVNVVADDKDGVALRDFSIMYEYKDSIACCKIYNDGRLYVNSYAQPSIAMNGDLSTTGWTYRDADGSTKQVSESQRSQMALVVTRPHNSEELVSAVTGQVGSAAAIAQSTTYEIDLNICGKILTIPNGSYMRLNLGIPDEFAGLVDKENIKFKLYHFKRDDTTGELDYTNPEEIECVLTPYGIIAEVNSFSPYVLVAVDNSKLPEEEQDTSKGIAQVCSGHGGKVESDKTGTLNEGQSITYTLMPDAGYEVEFVRLNGAAITPVGGTVALTYDELQSNNTLEVGFVATSVREAEEKDGIDHVTPSAVCTVTFDSNGGSAVAPVHLESGAAVSEPMAPVRSGYRFDGWYTDRALTSAYDFGTPVAASMTLYAKWTAIPGGDPAVTPPIIPTYPPVWPDEQPSLPNDPPTLPNDPPAWENPFTDVAEDDWYYSAVQFAADNGLFLGTGEAKFTPNGDMTRGMLATVLYRLAKEPEIVVDQSFSDVAGGQYYAKAVAWAAAKGIVSGYGNGNFGPEDFITREQLAVMLWRYAGSPAGTGNLDSFTDGDKVDTWAVDALRWAVGQRLVSGKGGGVLDPGGKATRAEVAAILMRYCETVK